MKLTDVPYEERLEAERRLKSLGGSRPEVSSFVLYGIGIPGFAAAVFEGLAGSGKMEENILVFLALIAVGGFIGRSVGREKVKEYERSLEAVVVEMRRENRSK